MTEEIIHLLMERNRHLESFSSLNTNQIEKIKTKNFQQINSFYTHRENILLVIEKIEHLINEKLKNNDIVFSSSQKKEVNKLFNKKDEIIKGILNQDLEILSHIDSQKSSIIDELKELGKNKKTIEAYKSGQKSNRVNEKY